VHIQEKFGREGEMGIMDDGKPYIRGTKNTAATIY